LFAAALLMGGCSSSDATSEDTDLTYTEQPEQSTEPAGTIDPKESRPDKQKNLKQQFTVQADTLSATPRKKGSKPAQPIEMRQTAQKKYYSVQIGAYKLRSNIDNNKKILEKRFHLPVIIFYENGIKLTRMCVGNFPTKSAAISFLLQMQKQYPGEYRQAWVAELKK
jgi:cell division septation protein DedD